MNRGEKIQIIWGDKKMAKLTKMKYRTIGGEIKINSYNASISKKIIKESGIDPEKDIIVKAEKNRIIIENR